MTDEIKAIWRSTPYPEVLAEVYEEGKRDFVPILSDDAAVSLAQILDMEQPKRILEIGTAIGYSGLLMLGLTNAQLVTIDIDQDRLERAQIHFGEANVGERVRVIQDDAVAVLGMMDMTFDFVLLDGPKGHYLDMLEDLIRVLKSGGLVFADDVDYLGLVQGDEKVVHKHRTIVTNMRAFVQAVKQDARLECVESLGNVLMLRKK